MNNGIKINDLKDIYKNIKRFRMDGHLVNPNWLINTKTKCFELWELGYKLFYKGGYFFWEKRYTAFK